MPTSSIPPKPRPESAALLYGWDLFISFALGAPPRGSRSYASDLARRLRERGFTVFFSEEEASPGATLDEALRRALNRAKCLVVVANRATLADPRWVRAEVEEFRRRHPGRPVIPISIDGALQDPAFGPAADAWLGFGGRIWIDETAQACAEGVASDLVVDRLAAAPRLVRAGVRWRRTVGAAFTVLLGLAVAASWFAWSQYWAERQARSGLLASESQLGRANDPALALLLAAESYRTLPTAAARNALAAALATHPRLVASLDRLTGADGRELNIRGVRFSRDGSRLYALAAATLVGWDLTSRRRLSVPAPDQLVPVDFVEHPDGRVVVSFAAAGDGPSAIQMWDVEAGSAVGAAIGSRPESLWPQILMPDGTHVALAGGGPPQVQVRTLDGHVALERLADQELSRTRLTLAADGRLVHGVTLGHQLHRWDAVTWAPVRPSIDISAVHENLHSGFAASHDGRWLALGGTENRPLLWDLEHDAPAPWPYPGHSGFLSAFAFSRDSKVMASASWDGTVRLWNVGDVEVRFDPRPLAAHKGIVRDVAFTPSSGPRLLATGGQDGRVLLWDIDAAPPLARRLSDPDEKTIEALAFSTDGTRLLAGRGADLEAWTIEPPRRLWRMTAHGSDIDGVAVLPDGRSAITLSSFARELKRWTIDDLGASETAKVETPAGLGTLAFAAATNELVVQTATTLTAYASQDLSVRAQIAAAAARFGKVVAGPGSDEVMVSQGGRIEIFGPGLQSRATLAPQADLPLALAGHASTGLVAAVIRGRNDSALLWPRGATYPDGPPLRVEGRQDATVSELAMTSDGQTLFGSGIGFSALWDLSSRTSFGILLGGHARGPRAVAASASRPLIATASWNGEILVWDLDPTHWADAACRMANRNLSCAEWRAVEGERPWRATCPGLPAPEPACR